MIDSKQLMQGNWVLHNGKPHQVVYISDEQCSFNKEDYFFWDEVDPISLTPEILEKAGFSSVPFPYIDNCKLKYWAKDCVLLFYNDTPPVNTYLLAYGFVVDGKHYAATTKWINNLHTLMNAYYALTQTELNIQL